MNAPQLQFLMLIFAGWVNRHQQDVIEYLQEENRALREQLRGKRLRFTDPVVCQKSADQKRQEFPNTGGWHDRRSRPCVRRPGANPCSLEEISLFPNAENSPARTREGAGSEMLASPESRGSANFPVLSLWIRDSD
jgi:hypothetical protein